MNAISKVLEFHEAFGCAIGEKPIAPEMLPEAMHYMHQTMLDLEDALDALRRGAKLGDLACCRLACAVEELIEQCEAHLNRDAAALLDALVDRAYFLAGDVIAYGFHTDAPIPSPPGVSRFDRAFDRVHVANMAKLDANGKPIHDANGKVVKPPGWVAADLSDLAC